MDRKCFRRRTQFSSSKSFISNCPTQVQLVNRGKMLWVRCVTCTDDQVANFSRKKNKKKKYFYLIEFSLFLFVFADFLLRVNTFMILNRKRLVNTLNFMI